MINEPDWPGRAGQDVCLRAIRRAVCRLPICAPRGWEAIGRWTDDPAEVTCQECRRAMRPGLL